MHHSKKEAHKQARQEPRKKDGEQGTRTEKVCGLRLVWESLWLKIGSRDTKAIGTFKHFYSFAAAPASSILSETKEMIMSSDAPTETMVPLR